METNCWVMSEMAELGWVGGGSRPRVGNLFHKFGDKLSSQTVPRALSGWKDGTPPQVKLPPPNSLLHDITPLHYETK